MALERLRVLSAAEALGEFTIPELSGYAEVTERTVRSVLYRERERHGESRLARSSETVSNGFGRPRDVWTVRDGAALREEILAVQLGQRVLARKQIRGRSKGLQGRRVRSGRSDRLVAAGPGHSNEKVAGDRSSKDSESIVRQYLEMVRSIQPSNSKRLQAIESQLGGADSVTQLRLIQERQDLLASGAVIDPDFAQSEDAFVRVARSYSQAKGITYTAWREFGVPHRVLLSAGISSQPAKIVVTGLRRGESAAAMPLTKRERDVLRLAVDGRSNQEIAAALDLSLRTVKSQLAKLVRKLGVAPTSEHSRA